MMGYLLTVALILTLIPSIPAKAESKVINNVTISGIVTPKDGEKPVETGATVSDENCYVGYMTWRKMDDSGLGKNDTFVGGQTYKAQVNLRTAAGSGYTFSNPLTVYSNQNPNDITTLYSSSVIAGSAYDDLEIVYLYFTAPLTETNAKYKVTLDPCGGTVSKTSYETEYDGTILGGLANPKRDGYLFDGWYDENDKKVDNTTVYTKDTNLYAKWTEITKTINNIFIYDIPQPYAGEKPSTEGIKLNNSNVSINYTTWRNANTGYGLEEDETFKEGEKYRLQISMGTPKNSGIVFANPLTVTYQGLTASLSYAYNGSIVGDANSDDIEIVYLTYTVTKDETILLDEVDIDGVAPAVGADPKTYFDISGKNGDSKYSSVFVDYEAEWTKREIGKTSWEELSASEKFAAGYEYKLSVYVMLDGYRVDSNTVGCFDGKTMTGNSGKAYSSRYQAVLENVWTLQNIKEPKLKGVCQIPDPFGQGALIGLETTAPDQGIYSVEILILDCTLLAQNKDAWIYTTGLCGFPDSCLWTVFNIPYGYYWTLFRIYDNQGNLVDEVCYGFQNVL